MLQSANLSASDNVLEARADINTSKETDTPYERVEEVDIDLSLPRFKHIVQQVQSSFGFCVRQYQAGAVLDILEGQRDLFVIAGTGSGKSLIYQVLPFLKRELVILVVCPTLSLMSDQVTRFEKLGISGTALNSETIAENRDLWKQVYDGKFSIVLASPEVLLREGSYFWETILRNKRSPFCKRLGAIIVDECHLVWGWRQFRKDYLGLGTLRAHFSRVPMVAMSATVTPNVLKFVSKVVGLRAGFRLYKQSIDHTNLTQFVSQISRQEGYSQLFHLLQGHGAIWAIPKTMIFVDSIDEATLIANVLRRVVPENLQHYRSQIVRPFHASLEPFLRNEYLDAFRDGECRILVCTDAAGMGVDIPDIEIVIQWGISEHLTLAMLWQRIGRAGRDMNIKCLAITFVHGKHLLPIEIPPESPWYGFNDPVDPGNDQHTKSFIEAIYAKVNGSTRFAAPTAYHKVDPPVLWYINTSGCRARCVLASFVDFGAYSPHARATECCDNCLFNDQLARVGSGAPEFERHRFDITTSIRYLQSAEYTNIQIEESLRYEQEKEVNDTIKPTRVQRQAVRKALDSWSVDKYGLLHQRLFPPGIRDKLAEGCSRIVDEAAVKAVLENSQYCVRESALYQHLNSLIDHIKISLQEIEPAVESQPLQEMDGGSGLQHQEIALLGLRQDTEPADTQPIASRPREPLLGVLAVPNQPPQANLHIAVEHPLAHFPGTPTWWQSFRAVPHSAALGRAGQHSTRVGVPPQECVFSEENGPGFQDGQEMGGLSFASEPRLEIIQPRLDPEGQGYNQPPLFLSRAKSCQVGCGTVVLPVPDSSQPLIQTGLGTEVNSYPTNSPSPLSAVSGRRDCSMNMNVATSSFMPVPDELSNRDSDLIIPLAEGNRITSIAPTQSVSKLAIPSNLPPGTTLETYLKAREYVLSQMTLASSLQTTPTMSNASIQATCQARELYLMDGVTAAPSSSIRVPESSKSKSSANLATTPTASPADKKEITSNLMHTAKRRVEAQAKKVEKQRTKQAMKDGKSNSKSTG